MFIGEVEIHEASIEARTLARDTSSVDTLGGMKRWFWMLDAFVVISFAVIGSDVHGFTYRLVGILRVLGPFLIALAGGIVLLRVWRNPLSLFNGFALGGITLTAGMLMRGYLWNEGTPRPFMLVSAAWFVGLMVGWRVIAIGFVWFTNRSWNVDPRA
ncbi:MAG: hypothetical protein BMS9Abin12_2054 [Acidimicrobiia bacterium]|nr:MAG: hypothetical protein BMS9Abin12_2054 [Acidimicrobiia bacterium]